MVRLLKPAGLIALLISPVLIHTALFHSGSRVLPLAFLVLQFGGLGAALLGQLRGPARWIGAVTIPAIVCVAVWRLGSEGVLASTGLTHAIIHSSLAILFGSSLLKGREPIVTTFMRRIRGPLQPELMRYGRQVTILWCACSVAQLVTSGVLLATAPLAVWSFFINVLSLPLVIFVFVSEILFHTIRFRHLPRSRLADLARVLVSWRANPGSPGKTATG